MLMSSIGALKPTVTAHIKFNPLKPVIDNFVFKLHYRITVILLLFACVTVCAREYFGEHIRCIADQGVAEHVIKTYCFFMATFTIVSIIFKKHSRLFYLMVSAYHFFHCFMNRTFFYTRIYVFLYNLILHRFQVIAAYLEYCT